MELKSTFSDGLLTLSVIGRVDAAEAVNLQKEVFGIVDETDGIKRIIVDADQMSFISSMGLRVMMMLKKKFDDMRIIGANPDVYNVFSITGFHKIITVEKALPVISLDPDKAVSGRKDVYQLTDDTVLKVFPEGTTKEEVDREVEMAKEAFVLGIPTAMAFDIVKVDGGRFGLIYESTTPASLSATELAQMLKSLHDEKVDPEGKFPYQHNVEKEKIETLRPYLGDDAVDKLLQMMSVLPDATSLLHGNLSLDCIMMQNDEPIFTNIGGVGYGHPVLDLAHLYSTLTEEQRGDYFDEFIDEYFDMESNETIRRNRENIVILSRIYDYTRLTSDGEPTAESVEESKKSFKANIKDCWDEILSRLRFKMDFNEGIRALERKRFYLDPDVNIDWIAARLGTNRHYVSDYFNKVLHTTFNDYINNLRLDYAAKLIREGRTRKSEICYDAGFNNDHTFRRLFKNKFGCLPSQFK